MFEIILKRKKDFECFRQAYPTFAGIVLRSGSQIVVQDQDGEDRVSVSPENPLTSAGLHAPHPANTDKPTNNDMYA